MTTHMGARVGMADSSVRRISKPLEPYQVHMDVNRDVETKKTCGQGTLRFTKQCVRLGKFVHNVPN